MEQRIVGVTGGMHTGNDPTFDLTLLQKQLAEIRQDLERVTKWVVGNGDPTETIRVDDLKVATAAFQTGFDRT